MMREAAVLVPVYRREDGQLMMVLFRHAQGGAHGGQLALPGGQRDPKDADLAATALREANEEIGLVADQLELLAALPLVETQTTGFRIAPFLARLTGPVPWRLQEREVAEVVELPVADLARPEVRAEHRPPMAPYPAHRQPDRPTAGRPARRAGKPRPPNSRAARSVAGHLRRRRPPLPRKQPPSGAGAGAD